ncbi:PKD domain-containing protein [Rhodocytophaga aerolata]|uniref:PKD domain-containing protein n=1 Tax=Rhodocytophaga aerolata TaxID=455078 RepID=A0ABT8R3M6_9BACT|nr:PKD domain-containing protein [Rhodocytophaga aerolata]MDO1445989.1 PKD domain-containing protein [Rhodocytophaga aerolata]
MKKVNFLLSLLALLAAFITSCKKDDNPPKPEVKVTADAGADQSATVGQTVTLDGSASKDDSGKTLTYAWAITKKPNASTATLSSMTVAKPTFSPDLAGEFEFELTVTSENGTAKDKVMVTATGSVVAQVISENITTDLVLANIIADPTKPDYFITKDIDVSAKLTINPGVVIEFESNGALYIGDQGSIVAKGTEAQKIVFTGKNKTNGFWKGIKISSANPLNELDYVEIAYGGSFNLSGMSSAIKTNLALNGFTKAQVKITNSTFTQSGGYGIFSQEGAELKAFANNTFTSNTGASMYVTIDQLHMLDAASKFTGNNGKNGVEVEGEATGSGEVTWNAFTDGSKYFVMNDIEIIRGVKIKEGATFEFANDKALYVEDEGYIVALGTAQQKITFTAVNKIRGMWKGIKINSANPLNQFDNVEVAYGGSFNLSGMGSSIKTNLALNGYTKAQLKVTNSTFTQSGGYGMYVQEGAILKEFANNKFSFNAGYAASVAADQVHMLDAVSKFNDVNMFNGIEIYGETSGTAEEVTWQGFTDGSVYYVINDLGLNSGVKVAPGAKFLFNADKALYVNDDGYIIAKGTAAQKVVFTGKQQTVNGYWKGIKIDSRNPLNEMDYVEVSYGGSYNLSGMGSSIKTNIAMNTYTNAQLKITNSTISNSSGWGIYVDGAVINENVETVNTFINNPAGKVKK